MRNKTVSFAGKEIRVEEKRIGELEKIDVYKRQEEALALLERGDSQRRKLQAEGVVSMNIGGLSETYAVGSGRGLLSQEAKELLRPWLLGAVNII